jgi:hypothetical protein
MAITITLEQTESAPGVRLKVFPTGALNRAEAAILYKIIGDLLPVMDDWEAATFGGGGVRPGRVARPVEFKKIQ